jgi:hypothetical protein
MGIRLILPAGIRKLLDYESIRRFIHIYRERRLYILYARVEMSNGQGRYISTLYIKLSKSKSNLEYLTTFAECIYDRLSYDGDILTMESGKSCHSIGTEVMHLHGMLQFLVLAFFAR